MPKGQVTLYFWYRDTVPGYAAKYIDYGKSAMNFLFKVGLFRLSSGYLASDEEAVRAQQQFGNQQLPGAPCVGHVSMRTYQGGENNEGIYASFWPEQPHLTPVNKTGVKSGLQSSYQEDKRLMYKERGGLGEGELKAHYKIKLSALDVEAINIAFIEFKNKPEIINWSLWGSTFFRKENTKNCAGLVEYLLDKGGFYDLIKRNYQLTPYKRLAWRYSSLVSGSVNGIIWGAMLGGKRGALIYSNTISIFSYCMIKLISVMKTDEPDREATECGITSGLGAAFGGGAMPIVIWSLLKGLKVGYRVGMEKSNNNIYMGILGSICGYTMGPIVLGLVPLLSSFPISSVVGAIARCLSEGTGLVLTPSGLLELAQHAEQAEKSEKSVITPILPSLGINSDTVDAIKVMLGSLILILSTMYILSNEVDDRLTLPASFRPR